MTPPIERRVVPAAARLLEAAGLSPVLARIYAAREIGSAAELDHSLAALPPFEMLKNVDAAAARLARAIHLRERIVIVADYDADGATACAVGVLGLRAFGADVEFVVPNRFEFGYGLTPEIVALAAQRSPRLLVTVDNGIASVEGVAAAHARGIDVLVTDHHLPGATLPSPAIIVNPNQPGCAFASRNIAGVGVMFYVLAALRAHLRAKGSLPESSAPNLAALLDLVALGTVADVVRLDQANRILVTHGLARIRAGRAHPGIAALFRVAGRDAGRATAFDLGFVAGPRLNAAGRLADMSLGIRCLLAADDDEAMVLARELDRLNRERRSVESAMQEQALADLATLGTLTVADAASLCVYRPDWHQGVVGIVASRLKDRFHRPAVVFARAADGTLRGSGRSIEGFHLRDALDLIAKRAPTLIARFGGHAHAAGLTLAERAFPAFAAALEAVAIEQLTPAMLRQTVATDGALAPGELDRDLVAGLRDCVWGQGMPPPVFEDTFAVIGQRVVGERHVKFVLARAGERFDGIAFNQPGLLPERIRAAYRPDLNVWNGRESIQLVVDHWLPAT